MKGARGNKDEPGGGYKRNFNKSPRGKFHATSSGRGKRSRSKSRG